MIFADLESKYLQLPAYERSLFWCVYHSGIETDLRNPETYEFYKLYKQEEQEMEEKAKVTKPEEVKLAVRQDFTLKEIKEIAMDIYKSRMFTSLQNQEQAVAKILRGREIGLPPMVSLEKIYVVNGKTALESEVMSAEIKRSGKYNYSITKHDLNECQITFYENGKQVGISTFTMKDAERAKLLSKDIWQKYPKAMLFNRALSQGKRMYCPDVCMGVYTPEELDYDTPQTVQAEVIEITGETKALPEPTVETKPEPAKEEPKKEKPKKEKVKAEEVKTGKSRAELIQGLKDTYTLDKIRTVKTAMKIAGKLETITETEFNNFVAELAN
jgi:hypothetical protein